MDKFEFYQKQYFFELERRQELNSSLSISIGVVSLLIGAIFYLISNFIYHYFILSYFFIVFIVCSIVSILFVIFFLISAYWNYTYRYISDTEIIREYENKLINYYESIKKEDITNLVNKEINDMLIRKYSASATYNAKNNAKKSVNIHRSNTAIVILVICMFFACLLFFVNIQLSKLI